MRQKLKGYVLRFGYLAFRILRTPIKWYWKKYNIKTRGVRVMLVHDNSLILVRHWYNTLWVMPGGGIKKWEIPEQAAVREIKEEIGLDIEQLDYRLGVYSNTAGGRNDTVHCFVVELNERPVMKKHFRFEISDIIWAPFDRLPEGTSNATKTRIAEYRTQAVSDEIRPW